MSDVMSSPRPLECPELSPVNIIFDPLAADPKHGRGLPCGVRGWF